VQGEIKDYEKAVGAGFSMAIATAAVFFVLLGVFSYKPKMPVEVSHDQSCDDLAQTLDDLSSRLERVEGKIEGSYRVYSKDRSGNIILAAIFFKKGDAEKFSSADTQYFVRESEWKNP
jgi:hypothetical protein